MVRRNFLKNITMGTGSLLAGPLFASGAGLGDGNVILQKKASLGKIKKPLAIAMWDFSWILRHHRYGEFENWEKVLNELAERGYNAIRLDVMPQYVAADTDGKITHQFRSQKNDWVPTKWGNYFTMDFRPREALLEFLPLCRKYGFRVALSSWFTNHRTGPRGIFSEEDGLCRAWIETLAFLQQHNLLDDNIIYVDLLNEFPKWHGFDWLKKEMNSRGNVSQFKMNNPTAFIPDDADMTPVGTYNALQLRFMNDFGNNLLKKVKERFPGLPYQMSLSVTCPTTLDKYDISGFGTLDYHLWFTSAAIIPHWRALGSIDPTKDNRPAFRELLAFWLEKKPEMIQWMEKIIATVSETAKMNNITCGNTEGWGPIAWMDYPDLDWKWVKEAGNISVDLARQHDNYKYICTSNFTHPQFKGIWEDVKWHRKTTSQIRA